MIVIILSGNRGITQFPENACNNITGKHDCNNTTSKI